MSTTIAKAVSNVTFAYQIWRAVILDPISQLFTKSRAKDFNLLEIQGRLRKSDGRSLAINHTYSPNNKPRAVR